MKVAFIFIVKDGEKYLEQNLNLLKRHGRVRDLQVLVY